MASNAGLKVGDKILAINKLTFNNKEPKVFLEEFGKLVDGGEFELVILRKRKNRYNLCIKNCPCVSLIGGYDICFSSETRFGYAN